MQNALSLLVNTIRDIKNAFHNKRFLTNDSQQANTSDEELQENAHIMTIAYEDFVVRFAREQLNKTRPQYDVRDKVG